MHHVKIPKGSLAKIKEIKGSGTNWSVISDVIVRMNDDEALANEIVKSLGVSVVNSAELSDMTVPGSLHQHLNRLQNRAREMAYPTRVPVYRIVSALVDIASKRGGNETEKEAHQEMQPSSDRDGAAKAPGCCQTEVV